MLLKIIVLVKFFRWLEFYFPLFQTNYQASTNQKQETKFETYDKI